MKPPLRSIFVFALFIGMAYPAAAIERKVFSEVDTATLTNETQVVKDDNRLDLVWYIPVEFWAATLSQDPTVTAEQTEEFLAVFEPYFIVAVVQADVSPFGAFDFYDRATVAENLRIASLDADGQETLLSVIDNPAPDVDLLLQQIAPVLGAAMGQMGQNFHFYVLSDEDHQGARQVSPYGDGALKVTTKNRVGLEMNSFGFEFPLDSLFVPRLCPNGRPAHVSWEFCPWTGQMLPK